MIRVLTLLLLSLPLTAAYVKSNKATYTSPTTTPTVTITPTAGNALIVGCIAAPTGSAPTFSVSSTIGGSPANTWSTVAQGEPNFSTAWPYNVNLELWVATNVTGGATTITCTLSVSSYVTLIVSEYSNMATSSIVDGTPVRVGGSSTTPTSGTVTTTNANDLIVGLVTKVGSATITAGSGFTIRQEEEPEDAVSGALEDMSVTATGAYSSSFTLGASAQWYILTAAFKESGGGPPPTTSRRIVSVNQ